MIPGTPGTYAASLGAAFLSFRSILSFLSGRSWRSFLSGLSGACLVGTFTAAAALPAAAAAAEVDPARRRVVLLRPADDDDTTVEALARVRGELTAALFEVVEVAPPVGMDFPTALQTVGRDMEAMATFGIVRNTAPLSADQAIHEVWVHNRLEEKTIIQRRRISRNDPSRGAVVLAVQAVELLKASLSQFWVTAPPATPPSVQLSAKPAPEPAPPPAVEARPPYFLSGVAVQAGVGWLQSFRDLGAVWQPVAKVSVVGAGGMGVRLTLSGLGTKSQAEAASVGTARIDQKAALLELVKVFGRGRRLQMLTGAGGGVGMVQVDGAGVSPFTGRSEVRWSLLTGAGVAAMFVVHRRLALIAGLAAYLAWPHAMIRIDTTEVGQIGWPAVMLDAAVVGVL